MARVAVSCPAIPPLLLVVLLGFLLPLLHQFTPTEALRQPQGWAQQQNHIDCFRGVLNAVRLPKGPIANSWKFWKHWDAPFSIRLFLGQASKPGQIMTPRTLGQTARGLPQALHHGSSATVSMPRRDETRPATSPPQTWASYLFSLPLNPSTALLQQRLPWFPDVSPAADQALIRLLVHHCSAVYVEDTAALAAWNCSRCTISPVQSFVMTSLIIDTVALLQAYVGLHHDQGLIVVCFRGTHTTYMKNWVDDLWALELDLDYPGVDHALVHRGFYYAYHRSELRPQVTAEVLRLLALYPTYGVAVTGHSLGGALASLCALDLVVGFGVPADRLRVSTFGSPRVGNSVFAAFFKKSLPSSVRVTHGHDLVVHLPPHAEHAGLLAYHHLAQEVWFYRVSHFSKVEAFKTCDGSGEDAACSRSVPGSSIWDHLVYLGVPLCNIPMEKALGDFEEGRASEETLLALLSDKQRKGAL